MMSERQHVKMGARNKWTTIKIFDVARAARRLVCKLRVICTARTGCQDLRQRQARSHSLLGEVAARVYHVMQVMAAAAPASASRSVGYPRTYPPRRLSAERRCGVRRVSSLQRRSAYEGPARRDAEGRFYLRARCLTVCTARLLRGEGARGGAAVRRTPDQESADAAAT